MPPFLPRPELLAPAGNDEAFMAAVEAGADAVYLGVKRFNLRDRTGNFTFKELDRLIPYAHRRGIRVYLVFNSILKEGEMVGAMKALAILNEIGPDAVIVSDWGLIALMARHFPGLRMHGSTQLSVHNRWGLDFLARQGLRRVILARELTLDELAALTHRPPIEIEIFVHGALCFAYGGMCLASSYHGGRSANRGMCVQVCRRAFRYEDASGRRKSTLFSASDLQTLPHVPAFARMGVHSFKIEGRQRSAEYVHKAVSAYRRVIDASEADFPEALEAARRIALTDMGRKKTDGHCTSGEGRHIVQHGLSGNTGLFVGKITIAASGEMEVVSPMKLRLGDRLRVHFLRSGDGQGFRLGPHGCDEEAWGRKKVRRYRIRNAVDAKEGDFLFKVGSAAFEPALRRFREEYRKVFREAAAPKARAALAVRLSPTDLRLTLALPGAAPVEAVYPIGILESDKPLTDAVLLEYLARSGDTPFRLGEVGVHRADGLPPNGYLPPKRLKEIRRDFFALASARLGAPEPDADEATRTFEVVERFKREFRAESAPPRPAASPSWSLRLPTVRTRREWDAWRGLFQPPFDELIVPLGEGLMECLRGQPLDPRHRWLLPRVIPVEETERMEAWIDALIARGASRFMLGHFSQHERLGRRPGLSLAADHSFNLMNSRQLRFLGELGFERAAPSLECDRRLLERIAAVDTGLALEPVVYGAPPVFFARMASGAPDAPVLDIESDRGDRYRIRREEGFTTVHSHQPMSTLAHLDGLAAMGIGRFRIDLEREACRPDFVDRLVAAAASRARLPHTTDFNYEHGIA